MLAREQSGERCEGRRGEESRAEVGRQTSDVVLVLLLLEQQLVLLLLLLLEEQVLLLLTLVCMMLRRHFPPEMHPVPVL